MTDAQLQQLESLLNSSDLIPLLRANRPGLSDEPKEADGWERCMNFVVDLVEKPDEPKHTPRFIDVSHL